MSNDNHHLQFFRELLLQGLLLQGQLLQGLVLQEPLLLDHPLQDRPLQDRPLQELPLQELVHHHKEISYRPEPTLRNHHASATKIQAAYRGYTVSLYFVWLEFKTIEKFEGTAIQENLMATASLVDILIVSCVSAFYCVPYLTTVYLFSYHISEDFSSPKSV